MDIIFWTQIVNIDILKRDGMLHMYAYSLNYAAGLLLPSAIWYFSTTYRCRDNGIMRNVF